MKEVLKGQIPLLTLVVLVAGVGIVDPSFLRFQTLMVLISDTMTLFLMASGATFVIMMGGIDLSVQAVASMVSVVLAVLLAEVGFLGNTARDPCRWIGRACGRRVPYVASNPVFHLDPGNWRGGDHRLVRAVRCPIHQYFR